MVNHTNLGHALARCAAVAERLKEREVAPEDQKKGQDENRRMPMPQLSRSGSDDVQSRDDVDSKKKLKKIIRRSEDERKSHLRMAMKRLPMPASGNSIDTKLRGFDVKLVCNRLHMAIILSNQWLQKRRPYWDRLQLVS